MVEQLLLPFDIEPSYSFHAGSGKARSFPFPLAQPDLDALLDRDADCSIYRDQARAEHGLPPPLRFYAGVSDALWNNWPTLIGPFGCVSPVYGRQSTHQRESIIALNPYVRLLLDSGAFSDSCVPAGRHRGTFLKQARLSFREALDRQYRHMHKYHYGDQVEAIGSYDVLIDECWLPDDQGGNWQRVKRRWSEQDGLWAIEETVGAAAFLNAHRNGFSCIFNIQGVSPQQYLDCARRVLPYFRDEDILGLGGFCITGRSPKAMVPVFRATVKLLLPFLSSVGVKRIHVWGMCYAPMLGELLWLCDQYGVELSADSARPAQRPVYGQWGYSGWIDAGYAQRRPRLHLSNEDYQSTGMQYADEEDEILWMHYRLMTDEEFAEGFREVEHMAWLYDEQFIECYWRQQIDALRRRFPHVYGQVLAYDGTWQPVIQAQGAHRIEHVFQVRRWLSRLHETRWYRSPERD